MSSLRVHFRDSLARAKGALARRALASCALATCALATSVLATCALATCVLALSPGIVHANAPDPVDINPMQLAPDHVTASVADLDKEEAWYIRVFGFREVVRHKRGPDFEVAHLSLNVYHIDLAWQKGSVRQKETRYFRQGWQHVVFTTPILESAFDRLVKMGTDAQAERNGKGQIWRVYVHDPEGNEIELVASDGETRATAPQIPTVVPESVLPAGQDRELVIRTCAVCHPAQTAVDKRMTPEEWNATLKRMMDRGAVASPDEQARILDYLNKNFGR